MRRQRGCRWYEPETRVAEEGRQRGSGFRGAGLGTRGGLSRRRRRLRRGGSHAYRGEEQAATHNAHVHTSNRLVGWSGPREPVVSPRGGTLRRKQEPHLCYSHLLPQVPSAVHVLRDLSVRPSDPRCAPRRASIRARCLSRAPRARLCWRSRAAFLETSKQNRVVPCEHLPQPTSWLLGKPPMRSPSCEPRRDRSRERAGYKADASPAKQCRRLSR